MDKLKKGWNIGRWILVILICTVVTSASLSYSGFCFRENRFLGDEELIKRAINYNIGAMNIDSSEDSINKFLMENPKCCRVDRTSHMTSSWFVKIIGFYYVVVELNYERNKKYLKTPSDQYKFYTQYLEVSSCGDGGRTYGEATQFLKNSN